MKQARTIFSSPAERAAFDFREQARSLGEIVTFGTGKSIFSAGDDATDMYVVLTGAVEIMSHGKVIERMEPGDAFGIISLLDGQPRSAAAIAAADSELAVLSDKRFRFMIEETPNFVWYVMSALVSRLRATNAAL